MNYKTLVAMLHARNKEVKKEENVIARDSKMYNCDKCIRDPGTCSFEYEHE